MTTTAEGPGAVLLAEIASYGAPTEPPTLARRVSFREARQHFQAGARVLVSEHGHELFRPVTASTTTHSRATTTWDDLVASVREWRNRYPNQRFYVVDQ